MSSAVAGAIAPPRYLPAAPRLLEDIDIPEILLADLAVRHVSLRGTATIQLLASLMKLPLEPTEALFRRLNEKQYFEILRMSGDDYVFGLSPSGRKLAAERAVSSRYAGPAPVSLNAWTEAVRAQAVRPEINRDKLRCAFSDVVVEDRLLDALGPALISQDAMFLYGPSGTGKTSIAERLMRVFDDAVVVPWAIEVEGQIVMVADPSVHQQVDFAAAPGGLQDVPPVDPRWLVCRRPYVAVGGELVTAMLDLQRNEADGSFRAPLHMMASNGILLIDDFGRQMMSPRDLLNRWIVPLDRRVDFLSLGNGAKFRMPFELQIVFSTNLAPHELGDEAFLRRIPNKILLDAVGADQFDAIFHMVMAASGIEFEADSERVLRELCLRHSPDLRPCFPRDILNALKAIAAYEGRKFYVTHADLERAVTGYFV
ncbi:MAG: AAA family ATPase [Acidobacteriota bacterium]|nr:AAA family ATPase [Acidobacteriota bacterium]